MWLSALKRLYEAEVAEHTAVLIHFYKKVLELQTMMIL